MTHTLYAAFTPDGQPWAVSNTEDGARNRATSRRMISRARLAEVGAIFHWDYDPPDVEWSAALVVVTMTGTAEGLRLMVRALGKDIMDGCAVDLWAWMEAMSGSSGGDAQIPDTNNVASTGEGKP